MSTPQHERRAQSRPPRVHFSLDWARRLCYSRGEIFHLVFEKGDCQYLLDTYGFIPVFKNYRETLDIGFIFHYNIQAIGVWRSLVSRLVRVQEASGSNPDTPTKKGKNAGISRSFRRFSYLSGCAWFLIDFTRTKRSDCHEKKSKNLHGSKGIRR